MTEQIPKLFVKQRFLVKRTNYTCEFFDGYAKVTYENKKVAEETYKKMKASEIPCELQDNVIFDLYTDKSARKIYKLYLRDLDRAKMQNGIKMRIEYFKDYSGGENEEPLTV